MAEKLSWLSRIVRWLHRVPKRQPMVRPEEVRPAWTAADWERSRLAREHFKRHHAAQGGECDVCHGHDDQCAKCSGTGLVLSVTNLKPCGPDCAVYMVFPGMRKG